MRSVRLAQLVVALLAIVVASGCVAPQGESLTPIPDSQYEAYVHPILEGSCATLDCHGDEGRPLRLYSETGLRIRDGLRTPPGTPLEPIVPEELAANVHSLSAIDADRPEVDDRFLLLKPLSDVGGGIHHYGGRIWTGRDDPSYRCVRSWLLHAIDTAACALAFERDGLPPG